jgi:PBP1b-binding outer membrane lipoprotein LpoB
MKSLLSISILSVMLSMCGGKKDGATEVKGGPDDATQTTGQESVAPVTDETETPQKPELTEMPDTAKRQIIEHGAPDKSRNDSVKAAKTKGKF